MNHIWSIANDKQITLVAIFETGLYDVNLNNVPFVHHFQISQASFLFWSFPKICLNKRLNEVFASWFQKILLHFFYKSIGAKGPHMVCRPRLSYPDSRSQFNVMGFTL